MRSLLLLLVMLVARLAHSEGPLAYAAPKLLMEQQELAARLAAASPEHRMQPQPVDEQGLELQSRQLSLVDVRPSKQYRAGSLPFSEHVDVAEWKQAFGDGSDSAGWTARITQVLRRGPHSTVVVMDNGITPNAARVWWILKYWGVEDVRLLNGLLGKELQARMKNRADLKRKTHPGRWRAEAYLERLATFEETRSAAFGAHSQCIVDTRSLQEVSAGMIPKSAHAEWSEFTTNGRIAPPEELGALLERIRFSRQQPALVYCRSGGRASVAAFAVELMTGQPAKNYYGSWNDWQSRGGASQP